MCDFLDISTALDWLVAWLLEKTHKYSMELQQKGQSAFTVRNNIQVFHAQSLSIAYGQVSHSMSYTKWTHLTLQLDFYFEKKNHFCFFFIPTQRAVFNVFWEYVSNLENTPERVALERVASLYGANLLMRHIGLFYEVMKCKRTQRARINTCFCAKNMILYLAGW